MKKSNFLEIFKLALRTTRRRPWMIIEEASRNPLWLIQAPYFMLKLCSFELDQLNFLHCIFPENEPGQIKAHLDEIYSLFKGKQGFFSNFQPPRTGSITLDEAAILCCVVRVLKPEKVIETGAGAGMSSTFILAGLEINNKGHLYSIDLSRPKLPKEVIKQSPNNKPGWLIPEQLRTKWTLVLGKSEERLLPLLEELSGIDLFFHDSLHYFRHQRFEYETVWPFIKSGGLLLSHDISKPYFLLCRRLKATPIKFQGLGGIRKESQRG